MVNNKIIAFLKTKRGIIFLIIGLLIGLLLVLTDKTSTQKNSSSSNTEYSPQDYTASLEIKLEELINQISGVSNTKVMITLKSSNEIIYAEENSLSGNNTLVVDGNPVYIKEYMPEIEGVAVVCNGGNNPIITEKITQLLCAVLGLYSTHVYVTE